MHTITYHHHHDYHLCRRRTGIDYFGRRYHRPARDIIFRRNVIGTGCARLSDKSGYKSAQTFSTATPKLCIGTRLQPPGLDHRPHPHRSRAGRHGITIGSETSGSVFNVTFEDIRMDHTGTGQYGRGSILGCKVAIIGRRRCYLMKVSLGCFRQCPSHSPILCHIHLKAYIHPISPTSTVLTALTALRCMDGAMLHPRYPSTHVSTRQSIHGSTHQRVHASRNRLLIFSPTHSPALGIRMKSERGRGGVVSNVVYRNIDMQSIDGQCVQVDTAVLGLS